MTGRLEGKNAFVTGAAGGIGREICRRFVEEGARVVAADLETSAIQDVLGDLDASSFRAVACDIGDEQQVASAIEGAVTAFGGLDVLCNTAGGSSQADGRITEVGVEEFWRVMRVDLFGTFLVSRFGIPHLITAGGGSVINLTSVTALRGFPQRTAYSAAKGGIAAMTRAMAAGYGEERIRVNAIAPGSTMSPRVAARAHTEQAKKTAAKHVLGVLDPIDIAEMAVFLASDESRRITGQVHVVDSGFTTVL
ncbi:SDR family oxidoreductase [Cnuibacter physcomitrellae]|uniref:SDR family NAD(P)-dependent oxidoreductase n=1 Tax=Cnuibacter physcomitrellae TaxID=1619308 RepID=UPI002175C3DC|nr:SDR family NAD(P)-dependent oxidoreductase [Cnuibacter physcomitrellae]MCS5498230.1 SDR family oxidoreductase [Cnuibacter physcomitrellae]